MTPITRTQSRRETTVCQYMKNPIALYDLGVGPKSEWATIPKVFPSIKVFGCEPHPRTFKYLVESKFPGPLLQKAIHSEPSATLKVIPTGGLKTASIMPVENSQEDLEVECLTLDDFDAWCGFQDRILLWADIEGCELPAFKTGLKLIESRRVKWINIEERKPGHTIEGWTNPRELNAFLNKYGYVRMLEYADCTTHHDVIYVLREEL